MKKIYSRYIQMKISLVVALKNNFFFCAKVFATLRKGNSFFLWKSVHSAHCIATYHFSFYWRKCLVFFFSSALSLLNHSFNQFDIRFKAKVSLGAFKTEYEYVVAIIWYYVARILQFIKKKQQFAAHICVA